LNDFSIKLIGCFTSSEIILKGSPGLHVPQSGGNADQGRAQ